MSDADLFRWIAELDKRKKPGPASSTSTDVKPSGRSSQQTAQTIGTSSAKVEKSRTIIDHAPEEVKEAVLSGAKSINRAYVENLCKGEVCRV